MRKRDKTPLMLKIVRWAFPRLERFAPPLAHQYFIKIFYTPLKYSVPEKEIKAASFAKTRHIKAGSNDIQIYEWGEQPQYVLLVHGWAGRATQFRRFIKPFLNKGVRVVGFDGPAHGKSSGKVTNIFEFDATLKAIYAIYGKPLGIIAHSFGGVATLYSATQGLPVSRLVNIASPTIGDKVIETYLRAINGSWSTGNFFKQYVQRTQGKPFDQFSALHLVTQLPNPVELLLIHDENDKEVEFEHSHALLKVYPHAHLYATKKLGHTRILKDDEVIRKTVNFLLDPRILPS